MKILLRNTKTRLYASGTGQWVKSRAEAHDFGKSPQAYQHAKEHQLENAEVVFLHDDFKEAFTLPARSFSPPLVKVNEPVKAPGQVWVEEEPLAIERSVVPASILPDPTIVQDSLYEILETLGARPRRALQRLRAVSLGAQQARLLHVPAGSAGLNIERRSFLDDGRVVEFTTSWYRGDIYDFVAELQTD